VDQIEDRISVLTNEISVLEQLDEEEKKLRAMNGTCL
jgi:uncharacterized small protein (DUF1192 family)